MFKVLYFIRGVPTDQQRQEAEALSAVFRNPDMVGRGGDFLETCDAVYGSPIPAAYQHHPRAELPEDTTPDQEDDAPEVPTDQQRQEAEAMGAEQDQATTALTLDFNSMTVLELRGLAKKKGIALPAAVNTKAEITAYLAEKLAEAEVQ